MNKIKVLIFDYGGVISLPQSPEHVNNIIRSLRQDIDGFQEAYYKQRAQYDSAQISGEQYWQNIILHYGLNPTDFEITHFIQEDVLSWTKLNGAVIQFIRESKQKFYKLAMISNMTRDTLTYLRRYCSWLELFDVLCFSCDLGVTKPDYEIYAACLSKLNIPPEDCLFVDDSLKNVRGAVESGMHAILFTTFSQFKQELDEKFVAKG